MKEKIIKDTDEYYNLIGVRIFRVLLISLLIVWFLIFGIVFDLKIKIAIVSIHLAAVFIGEIIAMNFIGKYSVNTRFDFLEKVPKRSIFFKAKLYVIIFPILQFFEFGLLIVLLRVMFE